MTVKVGILSLAHMHAYSYAQALSGLPGAELVGIYDPDPERGAAGAKELGTTFFAEAAELLEEIDGAIVCSENNRHREFVELAAGHGCHILCEKPIATTLEDGQAMIDACARAGVKLQIAFPVRFGVPVRKVKEMLERGAIGDVLAIRGTNNGKMPGGWFIDPEAAGGGAVLDHTVHVIDLIRWYLGREFVSVYAEVDDSLNKLGIDDCGMLALELEGGIFVTQDPSWSRPLTFPTWGNVTLRIVGTAGVIDLDAWAESFLVYDDQQNKVVENIFAADMDRGLIEDFVAMIAEDRAPSVTGLDGLKALEVALAAYRSAELKQPVRLT